MIEHKVNLTDGSKNVSAYYLDKVDKEAFFENRTMILGFKNRIEFLENFTGLLRRMVKEEDALSYFRNEIMKKIPKEKSFHASDIRCKIEDTGFGLLVLRAFESLVSDRVIEYRGSGWYRERMIKK